MKNFNAGDKTPVEIQNSRSDEIEKVLSSMKRFISIRERCESEVDQYLRRKGYGREVSSQVIRILKEEHVIDDVRFAKNRMEFRMHRNYGPLYIKNELGSLKIKSEIITEALDAAEEDGFLEGAVFLLEKKLPAVMNDENAEEKLRRALLSRGFTNSHYKKAIETVKSKFPHWARKTSF